MLINFGSQLIIYFIVLLFSNFQLFVTPKRSAFIFSNKIQKLQISLLPKSNPTYVTEPPSNPHFLSNFSPATSDEVSKLISLADDSFCDL